MATIRLPQDFKEFLNFLASHEVEYLIVGGYAVAYHGYPRSTGDIDCWIAISPENSKRVIEALRSFGFSDPALTSETFLKERQIVRMGVQPFRIDIMTTISGVSFQDCYEHRIRGEIDGVRIDLIDLEHLKINKSAAGRHKDLDDLEHLP